MVPGDDVRKRILKLERILLLLDGKLLSSCSQNALTFNPCLMPLAGNELVDQVL